MPQRRLRAWARISLLPLCLGLLWLLTACGGSTQAGGRQLTITGSTSVTPFIEQVAELYEQQYPGTEINIQGLGSSAGIQAAMNGTVEIGMSSRQLAADEAEQLVPVEMARDALAIIVHPLNPIANLTTEQVRDIFTGSVRTWSALGGQEASIVVVTREAGSGTYGAFEELVMEQQVPDPRALRQGSNGAVRQIVAQDRDAVGYISLGIVDASVKPVAIDEVQASVEAVTAGDYKLVRPFLLVHRRQAALSPLAEDFLRYVLSAEGQRELVQAGLIGGADAE